MNNAGGNPPIRTCVACGAKKPKGELMRFVHDGDVCVDERQIKHGRGAYVCKDENCRETGMKKQRLLRSLQKFVKGRNRKTG